MLQLVSDERLDPDQAREFVTRSWRQAQSMAAIIDELVGVSVDDVPAVRTTFTTVRLADLVADAIEAAWPDLNGRRLEVEVPAALCVTTVPSRVRQILVSLLLNARDYSPSGTAIRVAGRVDRSQAVLEVADRGPGVVWEDVERLFRPFHGQRRRGRGEARRLRLGLGLYVARCLAESLDGTAALLPREGGGTVARVVLPQRRLHDTSGP